MLTDLLVPFLNRIEKQIYLARSFPQYNPQINPIINKILNNPKHFLSRRSMAEILGILMQPNPIVERIDGSNSRFQTCSMERYFEVQVQFQAPSNTHCGVCFEEHHGEHGEVACDGCGQWVWPKCFR
jgi:hypothetical protein